MPAPEEFVRTGAPPESAAAQSMAVQSMSAEQRGRHNFARMLRALVPRAARVQAG